MIVKVTLTIKYLSILKIAQENIFPKILLEEPKKPKSIY